MPSELWQLRPKSLAVVAFTAEPEKDGATIGTSRGSIKVCIQEFETCEGESRGICEDQREVTKEDVVEHSYEFTDAADKDEKTNDEDAGASNDAFERMISGTLYGIVGDLNDDKLTGDPDDYEVRHSAETQN